MKIVIVGYGTMGHVLEQVVNETADIELTAIVGKDPVSDVYQDLAAITVDFDCIVDFSHHSNIENILRFAQVYKKPAVIAVTGLSTVQQEGIQAAAWHIPVLYSQNLSIGINALTGMLHHLSKVLGEHYDIELIEKHHNRKEDAPSGTAQLLLSAIDGIADKTIVNGRKGLKKRTKNEIGVHAVRGGTIVGEHTILFAGNDEMVEIKHTALSKRLFAEGALRAVRFITRQPPGLYTMNDANKR